MLALVTVPARLPSLHAVVTVNADPVLAQRIARTLSAAASAGPGPELDAEAEDVAAMLPKAPAASFREAYARACAFTWPVPDHGAVTWTALQTEGEPEPDDASSRASMRDRRPRLSLSRSVDLGVFDPARLVAAASHAGWEPIPVQERMPDDPEDLLGAAMWLFDEPHALPGCEIVADESEGMVSDSGPEAGEPRPVDDVPDFAALFPVNLTGEADSEHQLTPRTADVLHTALCLLADGIHDDVDELGDSPVILGEHKGLAVLDRLPRVCWRQDAGWRRRLAGAADDLADDLAAGRLPYPRCTAEEMCLHLAIEDAEDTVDDDALPEGDPSLPEHENDYDWDACDEFLFKDHDVLMLNDPSLDGIEDPDSELGRNMRMVNLHPRDWFTPFDHVEPRRPRSEFRR